MTSVSLVSIVAISQMSPYGSIYMRANKTCKRYYIWPNKMVVNLTSIAEKSTAVDPQQIDSKSDLISDKVCIDVALQLLQFVAEIKEDTDENES